MVKSYPAPEQISMLESLELSDEESFTYFISFFYEAERGIGAGFANKIVRLNQKITKWNIEDSLANLTAKICLDAEYYGLTPETIHVVIINFRLIE